MVINVSNDEADLVHVGGDHDSRPRAFADRDEVTHRVNMLLVDERSQLRSHDLADGALT